MNKSGLSLTMLATLGLLALANVPTCRGNTTLIDFDSPPLYPDAFSQVNNSAPTTLWNVTPLAGITGNALVPGSGGSSAVYQSSTWLGFPVTAGGYFKYGSPTGAGPVMQYGFSTYADRDLKAAHQQSFVTARVWYQPATSSPPTPAGVWVEFQTKDTLTGTTEVATTAKVPLVAGNWYQFVFDLDRTPTSGEWIGVATLTDYGSDGLTPGAIVHAIGPTTLTQTELWANPHGFLALRGAPPSGVVGYDNLWIHIPEPTSLALLGSAMLLAGRRRRDGILRRN